MNAIGYIRISNVDQSTYSLEYQESAVRKYCTDNNLTLLEVFRDNGESSYTFDRPDWKSLEKFIKNNRCDYLIIYNHDRFSRNLAEALMKIKELHDKYGIKVLATTDRIDIDLTDPSNYIMRAFSYMMAESELLRIRERIKAGMMHAAISGYHANAAPIGYKNVRTPEGKPTLQEDPEKAPFIREIFRLRLAGNSPEMIRSVMKEKGFKQKGNSAIQRILSNAVYAGYVKVPAYKINPAYITKGKHQGIISEDDYWNAQTESKPVAIQNKEEVPLRGVLKCWCGKPVTAGNSKGKNKYYWYYLCSEHRQNLSANKLHTQLNDILAEVSFSADDVDWFRDRFMYQIGQMVQERGQAAGDAELRLKQLNVKIQKTEEKYLSNTGISEETFKKVIGEMKRDAAELKKEISLNAATTASYMKAMERLLPKLLDLKSAFEMMDLSDKRAFIKTFFGESLSYANGVYRTPFLHPLIEDKQLVLKEKGLLLKEQPVIKLGATPIRTQEGNVVEHLQSLDKLLNLFKIA